MKLRLRKVAVIRLKSHSWWRIETENGSRSVSHDATFLNSGDFWNSNNFPSPYGCPDIGFSHVRYAPCCKTAFLICLITQFWVGFCHLLLSISQESLLFSGLPHPLKYHTYYQCLLKNRSITWANGSFTLCRWIWNTVLYSRKFLHPGGAQGLHSNALSFVYAQVSWESVPISKNFCCAMT